MRGLFARVGWYRLALRVCLFTSSFAGAQSLTGQVVTSETSYRDDQARRLHEVAMAARGRADGSVLRYSAVVKQRIAAGLRMPLKDRTLYRSESSHRLWWNRDHENLIQVLAFREQTPAGVNLDEIQLERFVDSFDPMNDRLFFGLAEDGPDGEDSEEQGFSFEHPLYPAWIDSYWFSTGDTVAVHLPDGQRIRSVELRVVPRAADVHRMTGSLWIEPETGALTRAVYRLSDTFDALRDVPDLRDEAGDGLRFVPGLFRPWTFDLRIVVVDYGLWDLEVWMPRSMRLEGVASAGILKVPVTLDYAYEIDDVTSQSSRTAAADEDLPELHFPTRSEAMAYLRRGLFGDDVPIEVHSGVGNESGRARVMVPVSRSFLATSPELPPPVWNAAPGFASPTELRDMFEGLDALPDAPTPATPVTFRWGLQRPDLVRYNRVESLSVGAIGRLRSNTPAGPVSIGGTARLGLADRHPNGRLEVTRETLRRRVTGSWYHELTAIDEGARHLGLGNSVMAAFLGRDDGDYFYRSGVSAEWAPPAALRRSYRVRSYAEYHRSATVSTDVALFRLLEDGWSFRPNVLADEGWEVGAVVDVNPWWGSDPRSLQGGFDLMVQAATGAADFARASLTGRVIAPAPSGLRLALEGSAGTSWGRPTVQRLWYLGGARTLRGFAPRTAVGGDYARGRVEIAKTFTWGALSAFSDYGWAGTWDDFDVSNGHAAVGAGVSLLDGLIRMDLARGMDRPGGTRLDVYLDGIL